MRRRILGGSEPPLRYQYLTYTNLSNNSTSFSVRIDSGTSTSDIAWVEYSVDGGVWTRIVNEDNQGVSQTVNFAHKVRFRGSATCWGIKNTSSGNTYISAGYNGNIRLSGNLLSLFYPNDFWNYDSFPASYACRYLFIDSSGLKEAAVWIPPVLGIEDCKSLFEQCEKLEDASECVFPTDTVGRAACQGLFYNCYALKYAPELPATKLNENCYRSMFSSCRALESAPTVLPAPTNNSGNLPSYCYCSMFNNCRSLTTAPDIMATKTNTTQPLAYMFQYCESLNRIKCMITSPNTSRCERWVDGVATSGTFIKAPSASWTRGVSGIPSGWTVQDAT